MSADFFVLFIFLIFNIIKLIDVNSYTIHLSTPASEEAFLNFVANHADVEVVPNGASANTAFRDTTGNFQRISLAAEGGSPISSEYLEWRLNQSINSPSLSKEEFLTSVEKRKTELLKK